jgi:hypothetical protein
MEGLFPTTIGKIASTPILQALGDLQPTPVFGRTKGHGFQQVCHMVLVTAFPLTAHVGDGSDGRDLTIGFHAVREKRLT